MGYSSDAPITGAKALRSDRAEKSAAASERQDVPAGHR